MKKILIAENEVIIANRIKELIEKINKDVPNFVLLGICLFEDKEAGIRITDSMQNHFKTVKILKNPITEGQITEAKSVSLKGRFFEKIRYEDLLTVNFSEFVFQTKEILFKDITIIQSFNHVRRNTVLFKFKQQNTFFIISNTIEKILKILPSHFIQVHQSFVVNRHYATRQNSKYILVENEKIPLGRSFKNDI